MANLCDRQGRMNEKIQKKRRGTSVPTVEGAKTDNKTTPKRSETSHFLGAVYSL